MFDLTELQEATRKAILKNHQQEINLEKISFQSRFRTSVDEAVRQGKWETSIVVRDFKLFKHYVDEYFTVLRKAGLTVSSDFESLRISWAHD